MITTRLDSDIVQVLHDQTARKKKWGLSREEDSVVDMIVGHLPPCGEPPVVEISMTEFQAHALLKIAKAMLLHYYEDLFLPKSNKERQFSLARGRIDNKLRGWDRVLSWRALENTLMTVLRNQAGAPANYVNLPESEILHVNATIPPLNP
jgi:hypothetical protein